MTTARASRAKLPKLTHTPGPWEAIPRNKAGHHPTYRIRQAKPRYPKSSHVPDSRLQIADVLGHRLGSADNVPGDGPTDLSGADHEGCQAANVRLIVSAPDLLAAMRDAYTLLIARLGPAHEVTMRVGAAISKATGV